MRPGAVAVVALAAIALCVGLYLLTGGHLVLLSLPLLLGLPLVSRRR